MTLIDQAMIKAFQRREHSTSKHRHPVSMPRELFVHAPEELLRGLHHAPRADSTLAAEPQPAPVPRAESEPIVSQRETAKRALEPLRPAWETDAFRETEICRTIRSRLHEQIRDAAADLLMDTVRGRPVVCVTGLGRGEGRTTVATLLAQSLVALGQSVILVDADQSNPSLSAHLGVASDCGWHPELCEAQDVAECCVHSLSDGFSILPLDPNQAANHRSLLGEMNDVLTLLANHFDVVVVDMGVFGADATNWPQAHTCSYVVVRDARRSDDLALEQLIARIARTGGPRVRVVENFASSQV